MFIGHYAVALAAKKAAPHASLGTLFIAAQLLDLLWPVFLLLGLEHVRIDPGNTAVTPLDFYDYPITHSLAGAVAWSVAFAVLYFFAARRYRKGTWIAGLCVLSHWVLDYITHRPDLPIGFTGDGRVGAGLWNSLAWTLIVEAGLFAVGIAVYLTATKSRDRIGLLGYWALVAFLFGIYLGNLFGSPPASAGLIAVAGNATWLFVLWAYWVDRHRDAAGIKLAVPEKG